MTKNFDLSNPQKKQQEISDDIWALAKHYKEDSHSLLSLLRTLEFLHRNICDELFQPSIPNNRQDLYKLIKEIEETGGWPYIERMRLKNLLANWLETINREDE